MTRRYVVYVAVLLSLCLAPAALHAQFGGALRRKADELLKGKPAAPATPAAPAAPPSPSSSGSSAPDRPQPSAPAKSADPLAMSSLELDAHANRLFRDGMERRNNDWAMLPYIGRQTVQAARNLDDAARVAFVQTVGTTFKAIVTSEAYANAHATWLKNDRHAVDHGLKGVVSMEELMRGGNMALLAPAMRRDQSLGIVESASTMSEADIRQAIANNLPSWERSANDATRKDRAQYRKLVTDANAVLALLPGNLDKARRAYAALNAADQDGAPNESELYADADRARAEREQLAFDKWNLKTQLKQSLQAFVATASSVDFAAQTAQKSDSTVFVNPTYEKKGAVWKACFRAGKPATEAALEIARSWLKEL